MEPHDNTFCLKGPQGAFFCNIFKVRFANFLLSPQTKARSGLRLTCSPETGGQGKVGPTEAETEGGDTVGAVRATPEPGTGSRSGCHG